ncbi:ribosome biogenesis protein Nop16 [Panaeolus papilionaceus]|nr:ribosome biogenesis protein Nop16 [Panaeolus papilionaceus]
MANPRQRRKSRSSSYKPVSQSRRANKNLKKVPPIRGPKLLQDAWDKQKTVRQNYANLGLVLSLDPITPGGTEMRLEPQHQEPIASTSTSISTANQNEIGPPKFGRILRDDSGNVIGFELDDNEPPNGGESNKMENLNDDSEAHKCWIDLSTNQPSRVNQQLIEDLSAISAPRTGTNTLSVPISGVGARHVSAGELKYLNPLIQKYGGDITAMARDRRFNPEQRTSGQLKRSLKKAGFDVDGTD